jgi:predicted DNA-binding protein YlxM (UPF0122 family)
MSGKISNNSVSDEIKREFNMFEEIEMKEYFDKYNECLTNDNVEYFYKNYTYYIDADSPNVKYFRKKV